jgi:hypothetical protein
MKLIQQIISIVCSASVLFAAGACPTAAEYAESSWEWGSAVTVYMVAPTGGALNGHTTPVQDAFPTWNSDTKVGSGMCFTNSVVSTAPGSPSGLYVIASIGDTSVACFSGADACTITYFDEVGYVSSAQIVIDSSAPTDDYFPELMIHEVGHTYNIDDCPDEVCSTNITAMISRSEDNRARRSGAEPAGAVSKKHRDLRASRYRKVLYAVTVEIPDGRLERKATSLAQC